MDGVPEIVATFAAHAPVTPVGKPEKVAPVAPVVVYVIFVIVVLIHFVCASVPTADVLVLVFAGLTVIVPVAFTLPQPPVNGMLQLYVPANVGVPEMVIVLVAHTAVTPAGKPVADPIPVALVVVCVIAVKAVFTHKVGVELAAPTVLAGLTVIVPVALTDPQPPVKGILQLYVPANVGVPEMVIVLVAHKAVTPAGKPVAAPIPVALVVACVIAVKAVFTHKVGVELAAPTVLAGRTVIVPVAFTDPQPPVNGILQLYVPANVGVPEMVIVLVAHKAVTPAGKPVAAPIPVALVVV